MFVPCRCWRFYRIIKVMRQSWTQNKWIWYGKESPISVLWKFPFRIPSVHSMEMEKICVLSFTCSLARTPSMLFFFLLSDVVRICCRVHSLPISIVLAIIAALKRVCGCVCVRVRHRSISHLYSIQVIVNLGSVKLTVSHSTQASVLFCWLSQFVSALCSFKIYIDNFGLKKCSAFFKVGTHIKRQQRRSEDILFRVCVRFFFTFLFSCLFSLAFIHIPV